MKLLDLPKGAKIIEPSCSDGSTYIIFHHLDGMYSYCTTEKGGTIHLRCDTPLTKREDGDYEIKASDL